MFLDVILHKLLFKLLTALLQSFLYEIVVLIHFFDVKAIRKLTISLDLPQDTLMLRAVSAQAAQRRKSNPSYVLIL